MTEFLHAADLHLKERTWKHRCDVSGDAFCALRQIEEYLDKNDAISVVAFSGDIVDSRNPSDVTIRSLLSCVQNIQERGVQVVVVSGNHDPSAESHWTCMPGVHALHLGGNTSCTQLHGLNFYGMDFTPQSRLMESLVRIPADADVVLMHQMLVEAAGNLYPGDLSVEDLPPARDKWRYYAMGDYHGSWTWKSDELKVVAAYPGSTYPTSISEFSQKMCWHVSMEPGGKSPPVMKSFPLESRQLIKVAIEGVEDLSRALSEVQAEITVGKNQEIAHPVVLVVYTTFPGAASLISEKFGDLDAHLVMKPRPSDLAGLDVESAESVEQPVSLEEAIRQVMDNTFDKDTAGLTQELLGSASPADVVAQWRSKFTGDQNADRKTPVV